MSSHKFNVLCPNGRRVVIRGDKQTSFLQIIEEACLKQGFKPELFDIKHLRKLLDPFSTVQYSGLPNQAQLELVDAPAARVEQNVTVHLATGSGQRLVGEFAPSTTLGDILLFHSESFEDKERLDVLDGTEPVVVYTMKKVSGEGLQSTTLKSLGVVSGKCMLRYCRQTVQIGGPVQANVTSELRKPLKTEPIIENPSSHNNLPPPDVAQCDPNPNVQEQAMDVDEPQAAAANVVDLEHPDIVQSHAEDPDLFREQVHEPPQIVENHIPPRDESAPSQSFAIGGRKLGDPLFRCKKNVEQPSCSRPREEEEFTTIPLGSQKAILYNQREAPPSDFVDEDDSFYELSVSEIRQRQKDLSTARQELEEAPLKTQQLRELDESQRVLSLLNKYPETILRIYFPDDHVIQASFKPLTSVAKVYEFLRPFLVESSMEFTLYNSFPSEALSLDKNLLDSNCSPKARLYFNSTEKRMTYLNDETLSKKSSYRAAAKVTDEKRARTDLASTGAIPKTNRGQSSDLSKTSNKTSDPSKLKSFLKLHK